jgi:hypothetical protein
MSEPNITPSASWLSLYKDKDKRPATVVNIVSIALGLPSLIGGLLSASPYLVGAGGALLVVFIISFIILRQTDSAADEVVLLNLETSVIGDTSRRDKKDPDNYVLPFQIQLLPPKDEDAPPLQDKPHIVVASDHFPYALALEEGVFRLANSGVTHNGVIIRFENVPTDPPRKIGIPLKVHARISFEAIPHKYTLINTPINYGCWVDHSDPFVDFPLNTPRSLVLATSVFGGDPKTSAWQIWGYSLVDKKMWVPVHLGPRFAFNVKVALIIGEQGEWTHHFAFEWELYESGSMRLDDVTPRLAYDRFFEKDDDV